MMITALISPPAPDLITRVEATDWEICRPNNCYSSFAGTVNSLTGNATGLTTGELRLQMRGRLPLTRSTRGIDLGRANIDLLDLLDEGAGAGELAELALPGGVRLVPLWSRGPTTQFSEVPPPGAQPNSSFTGYTPSGLDSRLHAELGRQRARRDARIVRADEPVGHQSGQPVGHLRQPGPAAGRRHNRAVAMHRRAARAERAGAAIKAEFDDPVSPRVAGLALFREH